MNRRFTLKQTILIGAIAAVASFGVALAYEEITNLINLTSSQIAYALLKNNKDTDLTASLIVL